MRVFALTLNSSASGVSPSIKGFGASDYFTRSCASSAVENTKQMSCITVCAEPDVLRALPPAAGDEKGRAALLHPPRPPHLLHAFPLPVSYTAVSLNYLGHQLASRVEPVCFHTSPLSLPPFVQEPGSLLGSPPANSWPRHSSSSEWL